MTFDYILDVVCFFTGAICLSIGLSYILPPKLMGKKWGIRKDPPFYPEHIHDEEKEDNK